MSKTIETVVSKCNYENENGAAECVYTYKVITEPGEFYPVVVSVELVSVVDEGVTEDTPYFVRRTYEKGTAERIAMERGIVAKHLDIDPSSID